MAAFSGWQTGIRRPSQKNGSYARLSGLAGIPAELSNDVDHQVYFGHTKAPTFLEDHTAVAYQLHGIAPCSGPPACRR